MRVSRAAALTALFLAACSSPAPNQRVDEAEVTALAPLKQKYPDIVMGFDVKPQTTLIVSLDLQHYIDADDDTSPRSSATPSFVGARHGSPLTRACTRHSAYTSSTSSAAASRAESTKV